MPSGVATAGARIWLVGGRRVDWPWGAAADAAAGVHGDERGDQRGLAAVDGGAERPVQAGHARRLARALAIAGLDKRRAIRA